MVLKCTYVRQLRYSYVNDDMLLLLLLWPVHARIFRFDRQNRPYYEFNTSKLTRLGFKFKSVEEMFDDCISSFVKQSYLSLVQQG